MADEEEYLTVSGERIALQRRHHSASCREFLVRCPRVQLRSLSAVTCSVWLVAYGLFVLCQVPRRGLRGPLSRSSLRTSPTRAPAFEGGPSGVLRAVGKGTAKGPRHCEGCSEYCLHYSGL